MVRLVIVLVCLYSLFSSAVSATDDIETSIISTTNSKLGPGAQITLNSPANGANTTNNYMHLNATVSDASPSKVWFYGGMTSDPTDLLYARENVTGTQTFDYNWNRNNFDPETGATMGLWHFDEGSGTAIGDESGNGNSGGFSGSPTWSADGRLGYALDFDGVDDYLTIPDAGSLDIDSASGAITIEAWLYPHASGGSHYRSLIAKRDLDPSTSCNYQISLNSTNGNLLFYNGHRIDVSSVYVPLNQWSYIAVTLSATEGRVRFYLNGTLSDSIATATFGGEYTTPLTIGTAARVGECYDGLMDEVRLTNRALSPAEIAANYTGGLADGTYYWKVAADDGAKTLVESEVRKFCVGSECADDDPPVITLTAPDDGATTSNEYMTVSATVSDQSNTTVWVYGDTTSNPTELLYVKKDVVGNQNIDYAWNASRLVRQSPNTMGLWHFDDGTGTSLADASGNGNGGTFVSAPVWSTSGKFGYALDLDGTDDYVTIPDAGSLDIDSATGEITMETWIYPHSSGGGKWGSIISKKAMGGSVVNYQISLDQTTGNLLFYSGHWPQIWISSVFVPLNQWSYVAVTLKAVEGRLRFYRNGVLLDSTVTYAGNGGCFGAANNTILTIGTAGVTGECYDGIIDEVRLTRRALSSAEIAANYKLGNGEYHWKVTATDTLANSATAGPRQFTIHTNSSPEFTNCPLNPITVNHCLAAQYDLDAVDPDGDSLEYAIVGNDGTGTALIDQHTGLITYVPGIPLDINRTVTITAEAHEIGGANSILCDIAFSVVNRPPFVSCGQTPLHILTGTPIIKDDILGGEYDLCDSLTLLLTSGPGMIDHEGVYHWTPTVSDTGSHHVIITASDGITFTECGFDIEVYGEPYDLQIDRTSNILPGHFVSLNIVQTRGPQPLGGYDLLISYDVAALTFIEATSGDYFNQCQWEYYSYRQVPLSECGALCPTGMVNLVALAEINNGSHHPSCNTTSLPASLGTVTFKIASDPSLKCSFLPVYFFWREFKDNRLWSIGNDSIYMSSHVYDFTEQNGTETWTDITDYAYGLPGRHGIPTTPSLDSIPFELTGYLRYIEFRNGGIGISCDDSSSLRGDINANGIRYEIADAVMYVNYFLSGIFAFGDHVDASIAASDVNNDGSTLSVGDLVLLIRIINGDAVPFNKSSTIGEITILPELTDTMLTVAYEATSKAGAALLIFHVNGVIGSIRAGGGASAMSLGYSQKEDELRLLVYDIGGHAINKGTDTLCIVSVYGTLELVDAEIVDYDGRAMAVSINQPVAGFRLEQNHPNPFNPVTAIQFCVSSQSHVTINVLNLLGQHVATLVDEDKSPGNYQVIWDGTDQFGRRVATGVYLYRLQADDHVETKKMLLIK